MLGFAPIGSFPIAAHLFRLAMGWGVPARGTSHADYELDVNVNADYEENEMRKAWTSKDPDEITNRGFNWTPRNFGDLSIINVICEVQSGTVEHLGSIVDTVPSSRPQQGTVHRFKGGASGETCNIQLTAALEDGQVLQQSMSLPIRNN